MIIDFNSIEESCIKNFKGGEKETNISMYADGDTKIMRGRLEPGASIGYHKHEDNAEIIYILKGEANILYEGEELTVREGCVHFCPEGCSHSMRNHSAGELIFFAVVK